MEDFVPKGTGNSRFMKSNISPTTTLSELITMLNNGTFPFDLGAPNSAGYTQLGSALNKANILPDAVATLIGLDPADDPQVKDALSKLKTLADIGISRAQIATGSYTGTGTYGGGNPNSLTFGFVPKLLYITARSSAKVYSSFNIYSLLLDYTAAIANTGTKKYMYTLSKGSDAENIYSLSNSNRTLSWYSTNGAGYQLNSESYTYHYVAIG